MLNSAYTKRGNTVDWQVLLGEFELGIGPERSLFTEGHPMVEDLKKSYVVAAAKVHFALGNYEPVRRYDEIVLINFISFLQEMKNMQLNTLWLPKNCMGKKYPPKCWQYHGHQVSKKHHLVHHQDEY
jgi:hypothetical protein